MLAAQDGGSDSEKNHGAIGQARRLAERCFAYLRLRRHNAGAEAHIAIGRILSLYLLERAARVPIGYPLEMLLQRDEFVQVPRLAEIACLRGLLALEAGNMNLARQQLRRSLQWFEVGAAARLARDYLESIEKR